MRPRSTSVASVFEMADLLAGVSQAEARFSEDFTGGESRFFVEGTGEPTVGWTYRSMVNHQVGAFLDRNGCGPGGATPDTASTPELRFNGRLDFEGGSTFDNADVIVRGADTALASYTDSTLVSDAAWTANSGLPLPTGSAVVVDFVGQTPDLFLNAGAGIQIDDVANDCPTGDARALTGLGYVRASNGHQRCDGCRPFPTAQAD